MLRNMNLVEKLWGNFILAMLIVLLVGSIGVWAVSDLAGKGNKALDEAFLPMYYLEQIAFQYSDFFYFSKDASSTNDKKRIEDTYYGTVAAHDKILENIIAYKQLFVEEGNTGSKEFRAIERLEAVFNNIRPPVDEYYNLLLTNPSEAMLYYDQYIDLPTEETDALFGVLAEICEDYVSRQKSLQTRESQYVSVLFICIFGVSVFILGGISAWLVRFVRSSMKKLTRSTNDIASGAFNTNWDFQNKDKFYKDEFDILALNLQKVTSTLENLINDMRYMTEEHRNGNIDVFMDAENYKGAYRVVAGGVNDMVKDYQNDIQTVLDYIKDLAFGNFNTQIRSFPKAKAEYKKLVDNIRDALKNIRDEIAKLALDASQGILDNRIDTSIYSFGWKEVLDNLNSLLNRVTQPIEETSEALTIMSSGDFSIRVKGEYKGSFKLIKSSMNGMADNISSYIKEISDILTKLSKGNLDLEISREYVGEFSIIKRSVTQILNKFNDIMLQLDEASIKASSGARQIADSSEAIAAGASEQSDAVQKMTQVMSDIS
ncbi:MAG: MCP four helix bundle domain-containing protein, partial [Clostridiales bacterium]|nr:MCP four helix bundle domain-containing protein [Clostridiales bacterium]